MASDWRKTLYQASIGLGALGIVFAFMIYTMMTGAVDTLGNAAYSVINSTNASSMICPGRSRSAL